MRNIKESLTKYAGGSQGKDNTERANPLEETQVIVTASWHSSLL